MAAMSCTHSQLAQAPPPSLETVRTSSAVLRMEGSDTTTTFPLVSSAPSSPSPSSSPPPSISLHAPSPTPVVLSPCAACKILRRRCVDKCVLAPYFPPNEPLKFTTAHKVFGASNIIKLLQDLPESQRADAVSSMVYEANARIRDPVYGCAGAICQLQKQVSDLQAQLAKAKAELFSVQTQNANLAILCIEMAQSYQLPAAHLALDSLASTAAAAAGPSLLHNDVACFLDDVNGAQGPVWETLWA